MAERNGLCCRTLQELDEFAHGSLLLRCQSVYDFGQILLWHGVICN